MERKLGPLREMCIRDRMGAEGEGEADAVLDECIASCRELGMGLDDIERAMSRKIKRLKYDEAVSYTHLLVVVGVIAVGVTMAIANAMGLPTGS